MPVVYRIKVTEGYGAGSVYTLPRDGEVIIGRHSKCGIRILDPDISRRQAKLTTQFGKWAVVPISSTVKAPAGRRLRLRSGIRRVLRW